jgi:succinate-semialdehyde dehydrogenase/glutarate-semialdehyde dehydrogenase
MLLNDCAELLADAIELTKRQDGPSFGITNPASLDVLAELKSATPRDAIAAIGQLAAGQRAWRARLAEERGVILRRWSSAMVAATDTLAALMTAEQGKPLAEARSEVLYAASYIDWFAEEGRRAYGETIPPFRADARVEVNAEPIGVCAAITPWNFPLAMIARKAAPALAAGCTMIVKPSELAPLSALAMLALAYGAGIPRDALMVLAADADNSVAIGKLLCQSDTVRKISFTGSSEVGRILMRQCADTVKKLSLELGGNAPFIVFDDADLDAAVAGAINAKFRNAGQTCVCANRFLVQEAVYNRFVAKLAERVKKLRFGPGHDPEVEIGPLIDGEAATRVRAMVNDALNCGARIEASGLPAAESMQGHFVAPSVLCGVTPDMRIVQEEIFGPIAAVQRFTTEAEAIAQANGTPYGLAAYFYSEDVHRCRRVAEALEFGMVGINTGAISSAAAPFGGIKQSGFGREGGRAGLAEYMVSKYVCSAT